MAKRKRTGNGFSGLSAHNDFGTGGARGCRQGDEIGGRLESHRVVGHIDLGDMRRRKPLDPGSKPKQSRAVFMVHDKEQVTVDAGHVVRLVERDGLEELGEPVLVPGRVQTFQGNRRFYHIKAVAVVVVHVGNRTSEIPHQDDRMAFQLFLHVGWVALNQV